MKNRIKEWIKEKLGITVLEAENKILKSCMDSHREFVLEKMAELKDYARVDADIGLRGNNTVILTGVYRNKAFVRFYDFCDGEFINLIEQMNDMKKHALIRHIDAPPSFHGVLDITDIRIGETAITEYGN